MAEITNPTRDEYYDLILRDIDFFKKMPINEVRTAVGSRLAETFDKMVKIEKCKKGDEIKAQIVEWIKDENFDSPSIVWSLAETENISEVINAVKIYWLANENPLFRRDAIQFLAKALRGKSSPDYSGYLCGLLKNEKDPEIRLEIVTILAEIGDSFLHNNMFELMKGDDTEEFKLKVVEYFGNVGHGWSGKLLSHIAENEDGKYSKKIVTKACIAMRKIFVHYHNKE
ncbi:MAG: hypothetical protein WCP93_03585 [Candidatus Berkelbacteria bacterium]